MSQYEDSAYANLNLKAIYGPAWTFFITYMLLGFAIILIISLFKLWRLNGRKLGIKLKNCDINLSTGICVDVIIICVIRIIFFVDPKGFERIYDLKTQEALLRIPQYLILLGCLFIVLYWRKLEHGSQRDEHEKLYFYYPALTVSGILLTIAITNCILYLSNVIHLEIYTYISNSFYLTYIILLMIGSALFSFRLIKRLRQTEDKSLPLAFLLRRLNIVNTLFLVLGCYFLCVFVWWFYQSEYWSPWKYYEYIILTHTGELLAVCVFLIATYQSKQQYSMDNGSSDLNGSSSILSANVEMPKYDSHHRFEANRL